MTVVDGCQYFLMGQESISYPKFSWNDYIIGIHSLQLSHSVPHTKKLFLGDSNWTLESTRDLQTVKNWREIELNQRLKKYSLVQLTQQVSQLVLLNWLEFILFYLDLCHLV